MLLVFAIGLLLTLILWVRLSAFLALVVTALCTGFAAGMPTLDLLKSVQNGIGNTLGSLVLVLAFGIMLGSLLTETGAAQVVSAQLLRFFGPKRAHWALALTGFVVGMAMFYNAGFVVLAPLVFTVAKASGQNLVSLAIAMATPLSVTHGFLPPHPGATAVANLFGADLGKTLLLGAVVAVPTVLVAGILFPILFLKTLPANPPQGLAQAKDMPENELPGFARSLAVALLPVLLMAMSAAASFFPNLIPHPVLESLRFLGDPNVAMLVALLAGLFLLGKKNVPAQNIAALLEKSNTALGTAASIMLVIAAGGAFKQVLVDSALGKDLAAQWVGFSASPLLIAWGVTTLLRIAVGSATVAGMTAGGIVLPLLAPGNVSPELMTLAVGAGSLVGSHVNDTGFWMFREWFGLSLRDTFRSWTLMETMVGVLGLAGVLLLDALGF